MISDSKKHRRMLYQGILIAVPLVVQEASYTYVTNCNTIWGVWLFLFSWNLYISASPFVYLTFNKQLRGDVVKIFPKSIGKMLAKQKTPAANPPRTIGPKAHPAQSITSSTATTHF